VKKKHLSLSVIVVLAGCSSGISGEFGGKDCIYTKITFKSDSEFYASSMGYEFSGKYIVDGDRITITAPGSKGIVFTKKGETLEAPFFGAKTVCKKL